MTHRSILSRLAITSLAVALLATAPASAMPTDPQGTAAKDPRQQDMHASTVQTPKENAGRTVQDARGEAAAGSSAQTPKEKAGRTVQDARGEAAAGGGTGSTGPVSKPALQGPPTWPAYPTPLPLPRPAPQPIATDGGDDIGLDLPVALLILAGTLAVGGGMAFAATKGRTRTRVAH
jgi:hypothetical protein